MNEWSYFQIKILLGFSPALISKVVENHTHIVWVIQHCTSTNTKSTHRMLMIPSPSSTISAIVATF
jgi:hypothetical protein